MKYLLWPHSLAARTALVLMSTLTLVQIGGLTLYALDRMDVQRAAQIHDIGLRAMDLYRSIALMPPDRALAVTSLRSLQPAGTETSLSPVAPTEDLSPAAPPLQQALREEMAQVPLPDRGQPRDIRILGGPDQRVLAIEMRLPNQGWFTQRIPMPPLRPWTSANFILAFLLMTVVAALLVLWAVRRLTKPVADLARAAEALGLDVNAPPLPEGGPTEIAIAASAFNTMAARIQRFVRDRTFLITAIGHDLRTPITRMRLRAEFVEDDTQRGKMLADLDELEAMVRATLEFGRNATHGEAIAPVDLAALSRLVLAEAGDARPNLAAALAYHGPDQLIIRAHPRALKRALANLVGNAVTYAGSARITLAPPQPSPSGAMVTLLVEDDGPGIPHDALEQIFLPFHRLETSRSRETGGVGLGLSIARNILQAHGGNVTLTNRPQGGTRAIVTLRA